MKKQNLLTKLKRTLLIVGILALSLGATGCAKAVEPVAATVVETTEVTTEAATEAVNDDGSISNTAKLNQKLLEDLRGGIRDGLIEKAEIDGLCDQQFFGEPVDYVTSAKKELHDLYDSLHQNDSLSETTPSPQSSKAPAETKAASQPAETKPAPKETAAPKKETPATQPTQAPTQPEGNNNSKEANDLMNDLLAPISEEDQKAHDKATVEWQDSNAENQDTLTPEDMEVTIQ